MRARTNTDELNTELNRSIQESKDQATLASFNTFGDLTNPNRKPPTFENTAPEEEEDIDYKGMYEDLLERIG